MPDPSGLGVKGKGPPPSPDRPGSGELRQGLQVEGGSCPHAQAGTRTSRKSTRALGGQGPRMAWHPRGPLWPTSPSLLRQPLLSTASHAPPRAHRQGRRMTRGFQPNTCSGATPQAPVAQHTLRMAGYQARSSMAVPTPPDQQGEEGRDLPSCLWALTEDGPSLSPGATALAGCPQEQELRGQCVGQMACSESFCTEHDQLLFF